MLTLILVLSSALEYLPIYGKSELSTHYYSKLSLGAPPQEKIFLLDLDSEISALTCSPCQNCGIHSSPYFDPKLSISCNIISYPTDNNLRSSRKPTLNYSINYFDGSKISGYLIQETLFFYNAFNISQEFQMVLGCNSFENGRFLNQLADGMLGLGKPNKEVHSVVESLVRVNIIDNKSFSICLGSVDGFVVFGGMDEKFNESPVSWVDMIDMKNYGMMVDEVRVGEGNLNVLKESAEFLISSGSSISFFCKDIFFGIMNGLNKFCKQPGKCSGTKTEFNDFPGPCYHSKKFLYSSFPEIQFIAGGSSISWKPESYIIRIQGDSGLFCIGISLNNNSEKNVLGSNFLRHKQIFFDLENEKFGYSSSSCEQANLISITEQMLNYSYVQINLSSKLNLNIFCILIIIHIIFITTYFKLRNSIILKNNQIIVIN